MQIDASSRSISDFFSTEDTKRKFQIPVFQRRYVWQKEEVNTLFEDLTYADQKSRNFFVGASVLMRTKNEHASYQVIDGQQRITTITLLLKAIELEAQAIQDGFEALESLSPQADDFKRKMKQINRATELLVYDQESLDGDYDNWRPRLIPLNEDQSGLKRVFKSKKHKLTSSLSPYKSNSSASRIEKAFRLLSVHLRKRTKDFGIKSTDSLLAALESLVSLLQTLRGKTYIVEIAVENETEAYHLFESLNSKGQDLSLAALLKNKLLWASKPDDRDALISRWREMSDAIDNQSRLDIVTYIHHFWVYHTRNTSRKKDLYDILSAELTKNDGITAKALSADLRKGADAYVKVTNSDLHFPLASDAHSRKVEGLVGEMNMLGYKASLPFLLYIEHTRPNSLYLALRGALSFLFRCVTVGGQTASFAEKQFTNVIQELNADHGITIEQAISRLYGDTELSDDAVFADKFARTNFSSGKIAKYILYKLELQEATAEQLANWGKIDLEHILPQSYSPDPNKKDYFYSFSELEEERIKADFLNDIGNLTLIYNSDNRSLGAGAYKSKETSYEQSTFKLTKQILKYAHDSNWTPESIRRRSSEMASIACKAWPVLPEST